MLAKLAVKRRLEEVVTSDHYAQNLAHDMPLAVETRWDEKAGLRRDAVGSQVIDALERKR